MRTKEIYKKKENEKKPNHNYQLYKLSINKRAYEKIGMSRQVFHWLNEDTILFMNKSLTKKKYISKSCMNEI